MWARAENNTVATNIHSLDALVANPPQQTETNRFDFRKFRHLKMGLHSFQIVRSDYQTRAALIATEVPRK